MHDVFDVAQALVSWATHEHGDEIDLIAYYGSYAQGAATETSDLDLFYTPAAGKNPPVSRTVLVEGVLFDFWPITWERLERFAEGTERGWAVAPALVSHARVLYARSDEHRARLSWMQQRIVELQGPAAQRTMIHRALAMYSHVLGHLGFVRLAGGNGEDVRHAAWKVALASYECLALANQTFLDRGYASMLSQLGNLKERPADLEYLLETIVTSNESGDIAAAAERLATETREVLRTLQQTLPPEQTAAEVYRGAYPELRALIDKLRSACRREDRFAAAVAALTLQNDVMLLLAQSASAEIHADFNLPSEMSDAYRALRFPALPSALSSDLSGLYRWASELDERLRAFLHERSISLNEFATLAEFRRSLGLTEMDGTDRH